MRAGHRAFLCTGDVYRRDTIDATHYPVFHQMEGVRVFTASEHDGLIASRDGTADGEGDRVPLTLAYVERDLKRTLEGMIRSVFGADLETRWLDAYFPFTHPSYELEILWRGEWLEVLGCGVVHPGVMRRGGHARLPSLRDPADAERGYGGGAAAVATTHAAIEAQPPALNGESVGWAFGLGLERLAMVLFGVPDIRLFWSEDARFLDQFRDGDVSTRFQSFSKYPPSFKDVSFWLPDGALAAPKGVATEDGGDEGDDDWEGDYGTSFSRNIPEAKLRTCPEQMFLYLFRYRNKLRL